MYVALPRVGHRGGVHHLFGNKHMHLELAQIPGVESTFGFELDVKQLGDHHQDLRQG